MTSWIVTISDHKTQEMRMRDETLSNNTTVIFLVIILPFLLHWLVSQQQLDVVGRLFCIR